MKSKLVLFLLLVFLTTVGADCVNDPIVVALAVDPIKGCYPVNTGNGSFSGTTTVTLKDLIPSDFRDKLKGIRVYDVSVKVEGPYPSGNVSGNGYVRFDSGPELHVLSFSGQYSAFANGVSLLNSGGLITPASGFRQFLSQISDLNNLPTQATLRGQGSGPAATQSFSVCIIISLQADATAN